MEHEGASKKDEEHEREKEDWHSVVLFYSFRRSCLASPKRMHRARKELRSKVVTACNREKQPSTLHSPFIRGKSSDDERLVTKEGVSHKKKERGIHTRESRQDHQNTVVFLIGGVFWAQVATRNMA
jgi:hypothetical protein